MVIKGRSRSNGKQLAAYLLQNKENDRADVIDIRGTARPDSLQRSLLEMSLSSELSKRGELGLYHSQINPAIGEDRGMTPTDWLRAADILEESLGLEGQKRAVVLHEKNGRLHAHIVWQRYDDETGKFRSDSHNYKKHDQARAQIEQELGQERTPQKREKEPTHKERLTELWQKSPDGRSFVDAVEIEGYYVANGNDRRPFRVVTPDGQSLDLIRQLDGIKTKAVRDRLQPIRADLWAEAEALQLSKADRQQAAERSHAEPERSDYFDTISDSQDRAADLKNTFRERNKSDRPPAAQETPTPEIPAAPPLPFANNSAEIVSEVKSKNSDLTDTAAAMLAAFRQRQSDQQERQHKLKEMQQQAATQTKKQEEKSLTDQAEEMLQRFRQRQQERGHEREGPEI